MKQCYFSKKKQGILSDSREAQTDISRLLAVRSSCSTLLYPSTTMILSSPVNNDRFLFRSTCIISSAAERTASLASRQRRTVSASEARISLVFALASQASSLSLKTLMELATETAKYVFPKRFESRNLEEALMTVPDLETVNFKVLSKKDQYEIREVEPYFTAETTIPGKSGFDFNGASRSFNTLGGYLFGKNSSNDKMEMTTPVLSRKVQVEGEKMEMTTPVITKRLEDQDEWRMSFVMPSKYGSNLPTPTDPSVGIQKVPRKIVAVVTFSGYVTDEDIKQRESRLRDAIKSDKEFKLKRGSTLEVAQYNPPFTLPFQRRNEIALELERKEE